MRKRTPEFRAYTNAQQRCVNPRNKSYTNYGGRGIEFRFKNFQEFIQELGLKPSPELSLDRINNDGHYEVGNVQWSTWSYQMKNRRSRVPKKGRQILALREQGLTAYEIRDKTGFGLSYIYRVILGDV